MDLSFQLYSARNFTPWDKVLSYLSQMGYTQVEGFGGVYEDAAAFRGSMDDNGLAMPTGHFGVETLEDDFDAVIALAETLGINSIFCPYLNEDQRPTDAAGYTQFARRLSAINTKVRATGRRFGWHNHDFEFRPLADGTIPQKVILDEAPDIDWEADIAWIIRGGGEPLEWIENYGSRITSVHVKDIAPAGQCEDEDGWEDVGHGIVAWKNILRALNESAKVSYFVMEHDNPNDFERFARRSFQAMSRFAEEANG
ncbi:sugar phosphate isomerase/epimerase family protein [Hoeflea prorocentri]|uniref:Sugar phosphate isomerase/epimerase n=1 Tax=Hoeflea prorocentri TaxID=1922333 RepID=A0A9X3UH14_9HYPH|nr:sugar phosphate isomerase/epimerase [Hoeflea prorocentri]MCY6381182.1 sugar phosphate isomerase/epimerase [Hoeflea prorocentri]MDA5398982.1 sugar phosphate isomerase/epimerase [Hoeflea prorocentri]